MLRYKKVTLIAVALILVVSACGGDDKPEAKKKPKVVASTVTVPLGSPAPLTGLPQVDEEASDLEETTMPGDFAQAYATFELLWKIAMVLNAWSTRESGSADAISSLAELSEETVSESKVSSACLYWACSVSDP